MRQAGHLLVRVTGEPANRRRRRAGSCSSSSSSVSSAGASSASGSSSSYSSSGSSTSSGSGRAPLRLCVPRISSVAVSSTVAVSAARPGAAVCGRSAGRDGRAPPPGGTTCGYAVSPSSTPVNGLIAARDTGGVLAPGSFTCPCPMPTGTASACCPSPRPGSVSIRRLDEPPDAGPHVRWCGRGQGDPAPCPIMHQCCDVMPGAGHAALSRLSARDRRHWPAG
jgi:hypothetical protein